MTRGSWARFGIQQTPYVDFMEGIYRYRFQGTMFVERAGLHVVVGRRRVVPLQLPKNYGDVHVGYYNGENYNRAEVNDQKGFMVRATGRPFARKAPVLRGLRGTFFTSATLREGRRTQAHRRRPSPTNTRRGGGVRVPRRARSALGAARPGSVNGQGYSLWVTPKTNRVGRADPLRPSHARHVVGVRAAATAGNLDDAARFAAAEPRHRRRRLLVQAPGLGHRLAALTTTPACSRT
jgi:hypothetical protein